MRIRRRPLALLHSCLLLLACAPSVSSAAEPAADPVDLSQNFGFLPVEIFKLEHRSANMLSGDLNHDGLNDLVIADNSHSRIDLLQQRAERPADAELNSSPQNVNEVSGDWRFEHRKISVDKQIASIALADLNGDGRTDIAYLGVPDHLVILYQPKSGEWTQRFTVRLPEIQTLPWSLAAGDLNSDDRADLAVLGKNDSYLMFQEADGKLSIPRRLMNTSDKLGLAQIADLDGDGRNDFCYMASDGPDRALGARLQTSDARLGPELRFELDRPRSVTLADVDGKPGREILTVESNTGRMKMHRLIRPATRTGELAGQLIQYGFGQGGRDRDLATGDLDADGLNDVIVSDPESAQMVVFLQQKGAGLDLGTAFPGLMGVQHVRIADFDGDRRGEVVVVSEREKTLGVSQLKDGRLTFPRTLPVADEPVGLELADLNGDRRPEIVYVTRQREGRSSKYFLNAIEWTKSGEWHPYAFGEKMSVELDLPGNPERITHVDINRDGRPDFMIFPGLDRPPLFLTIDEAGMPVPIKTTGGIQLGNVTPGAVFVGAIESPVMLVSQEKFARSLTLDSNQQWQVVDQYNASESNARIVGAATINLDGQPGDEVVLVDSGIRKLRVLRKDGTLYRPWREVEIGSFPYKSIHVVDLNGDNQQDLLLFGSGKFGVLYAGQTDPTLEEVGDFETRLKDVYFTDIVAGDLNADGRVNLAIIDTRSHFVELVDYSKKARLRHALQFKVFEEKSFSGSREGGSSEPREALIRDVTNDGLADLILLTHDRVLIYPQDDGR